MNNICITGVNRFIGKPIRLFPILIFIFKFIGKIVGKQNEIDRLLGSLKVDNVCVKKVLNWKLPHKVFEGIKKWYLKNDTSL